MLRRRVAVGTVIFLIPCALLTVHAVNETMAQNSGEAFIVQDSYEVRQTTQELEAICPGFVSYRVGAVNAYDSKSDALSQRLVATLKTKDELDNLKKSEIRGLLRVHIKQLDELRFEVEAKDGENATVSDEPADTDAAKPHDAVSAPSATVENSATK